MSTGCFEDVLNDMIDSKNDLRDLDVNFVIELISKDISLSSNVILIDLNIENNEERSIQLNEKIYFSSIINPNGTRFDIYYGNISIDPKEIIIESGKTYSKIIDLKARGYRNNNFGYLEWTEIGKYKCQVQAYEIESNWLEFEMI